MKDGEEIPLIDASNTHVKLPEHEHTFSWSNVSVSRPQSRSFTEFIRGKPPKPPRVVLQDMFGIARPGEILAIMGASGVGKTTLLNVLIGYQDPTANICQGSICLNGYPTTRSQRLNGSLIGFAEQHELFVETMQLEEHLIFQAMLRMPRTMKDEDRRVRVKTVINTLALNKSFKTEINRLSGGERKRLSLATVLLADPPVILIDEPTSGLDAYLAKQAMILIRGLANERRHTIVVVIHQPTRDMYEFMDSLAIITHGGRLSYFGQRQEAAGFFESECKMQGSSLDNFIEQLAVPPESEEAERRSLTIADCYGQSKYALTTLNEISNLSSGINTNEKSRFPQEAWNSSIWRQFKWLVWRSFLSGARDPVRTVNVVIRCVIPAILYGVMYFQIKYNFEYRQNINAITYATLSITTMSCSSVIVSTLPVDIPVYVRETRRRIYRTLPYFATVILRELPLMILLPFVFTTIVYWLADISDSFAHYVEFTAIMILACNSWASIGTLVSSFSSDIESAVATFMPIQQVLLAFCGFFFYLPSLPRFFIFIPYIAPLYYAYTALHALESKWTPWDYNEQCPQSKYSLTENSTIMRDFWCGEKGQNEKNPPAQMIVFEVSMLAVLYLIYNAVAFLIIWYRGNRNKIADFFSKKK